MRIHWIIPLLVMCVPVLGAATYGFLGWQHARWLGRARDQDSAPGSWLLSAGYVVFAVASVPHVAKVAGVDIGDLLYAAERLTRWCANVVVIFGWFSLRNQIEAVYDSSLNTPRKLSGAMTLLFGPFYIQHHMRELASKIDASSLP